MAGGLEFFEDGGGAIRLEAGLPWSRPGLPGLRFLVAVTLDYDSADTGVGGKAWAGLVGPLLSGQYEHVFKPSVAGQVAVLGELGIGPWIAVIQFPDEPFMPGSRDTLLFWGVRMAGVAQYRFHSGLILGVQPLGIVLISGEGTSNTTYNAAFMAGYQWR